jgi:hypothetical protein
MTRRTRPGCALGFEGTSQRDHRSCRMPRGQTQSPTKRAGFMVRKLGYEQVGMGGEAEVLPMLTLLMAVCEQSLRVLKRSPPETETVELVERLRAHVSERLSSGHFEPPQ